ncbi:hypothetical protein JKL49_07335 [Phenylobacterium sp. 20VBR1]|uniref:Uncharacterized protein n=1 Tax=Phenylobacterium glaciei TaxID=2803784 RepID=A0A941D0I7_9CAUL|nr:hypothetical protein [Phenylobacterium glaciei]MBR7619199.1 hypothetical protein [Phenylobacterium glaciei]
MSKLELLNSIRRRTLFASLAIAVATAAAPATYAATTPVLTSEQQAQVSALATKLTNLVKDRSADSSEGDFQGAMADAVSGYSAEVIAAALAQVAGTPGLPANAIAAAKGLQRQYASNSGTGGGTGAVGGQGGTAFGSGPGFVGGGGGSNYGQ